MRIGRGAIASQRLISLTAIIGQTAIIPPLLSPATHLHLQLVAGHRDQQFQKLLRPFEIVLPVSCSYEKTGEHGLTDILGIEIAAKSLIANASPHGDADVDFVTADQFLNG